MRIPFRDFNDVTLVSEDIYEDEDDESYLAIKVREDEIVQEVKRSDGSCHFACVNVYNKH